MCSYWRRSFELTPRKPVPRGMSFLLRIEGRRLALRLGRAEYVLPGPRRRVDLLLGPVRHVLGLLSDHTAHLGRALAHPDRPALGVLPHLSAPVPHAHTNDEPTEDAPQ